MKSVEFSAREIKKEFNRRVIFENISFTLRQRDSLVITGRNGSGKSTLAKILCGLLTPTAGTVRCVIEGKEIPPPEIYKFIGFVSPYINMYDEFSGLENLLMFSKIRDLKNVSVSEANALLERFNIYKQRNDEVRTYSSGMKQRLKYCGALLHNPDILILDEPTSNLDEEGVATVRSLMIGYRRDRILIVATNDAADAAYTDRTVRLGAEGL